MKNMDITSKKGINYVKIIIIAVLAIILIVTTVIVISNVMKARKEAKEQIVVEISTFKSELQEWISQKKGVAAAGGESFLSKSLDADNTSVKIDGVLLNGSTINNIIRSLSTLHDGIYVNNLVISQGKITLVKDEDIVENTLTKDEIKWINEALAEDSK